MMQQFIFCLPSFQQIYNNIVYHFLAGFYIQSFLKVRNLFGFLDQVNFFIKCFQRNNFICIQIVSKAIISDIFKDY